MKLSNKGGRSLNLVQSIVMPIMGPHMHCKQKVTNMIEHPLICYIVNITVTEPLSYPSTSSQSYEIFSNTTNIFSKLLLREILIFLIALKHFKIIILLTMLIYSDMHNLIQILHYGYLFTYF